jgi:hypothetical protein
MSDTAHQETESVVVNTLNWSPNIDQMLATWCDNAKAFEWMHTEAFSLFDKRSRSFMITVNCLTAISGLSNVIAGGYNVNGFQLAWIFGGLSIAVSTLNILQDKLGYMASSNSHMKLASDWSSIKGRIEEVITIPYSGRRDCKTFLKYIRDDIGKATAGGNSIIPEHIRKECYEKFKDVQDFDLPDICGKMEHTKIYVSEPLIVN